MFPSVALVVLTACPATSTSKATPEALPARCFLSHMSSVDGHVVRARVRVEDARGRGAAAPGALSIFVDVANAEGHKRRCGAEAKLALGDFKDGEANVELPFDRACETRVAPEVWTMVAELPDHKLRCETSVPRALGNTDGSSPSEQRQLAQGSDLDQARIAREERAKLTSALKALPTQAHKGQCPTSPSAEADRIVPIGTVDALRAIAGVDDPNNLRYAGYAPPSWRALAKTAPIGTRVQAIGTPFAFVVSVVPAGSSRLAGFVYLVDFRQGLTMCGGALSTTEAALMKDARLVAEKLVPWAKIPD